MILDLAWRFCWPPLLLLLAAVVAGFALVGICVLTGALIVCNLLQGVTK